MLAVARLGIGAPRASEETPMDSPVWWIVAGVVALLLFVGWGAGWFEGETSLTPPPATTSPAESK